LHLTKSYRPDILNPVRNLSRYMKGTKGAHMVAMYQVMKNYIDTKNGLVSKPSWDGNNLAFVTIKEVSDSDFAINKICYVSGYATLCVEHQ